MVLCPTPHSSHIPHRIPTSHTTFPHPTPRSQACLGHSSSPGLSWPRRAVGPSGSRRRSWILWVLGLPTALNKHLLGWRQAPGMALTGTLRSPWAAPASGLSVEVPGCPVPGCAHALLPPWVTISSLQEQPWNRHVPLAGPSSSPAGSFAAVPSLWVTLCPSKMGNRSWSSAAPQDTSPPELGSDCWGQTGSLQQDWSVSSGVGHCSSRWLFGLGLIPQKV